MNRRGFTLIELSIALVIIGLIVGGILVGQSLIEAAQIRSIVSGTQSHMAAWHTFRLKYNAIAGDFDRATTFWGARDGGDGLGNDCRSAASTDDLTCNGNANRFVSTSETLYYWQHQALAGLISGRYPGYGATTQTAIVGETVPSLGVKDIGISVIYQTYYKHHAFYLGTNNNHYGMLNKDGFTPPQAYAVDSKLDDGEPITGKLIAESSSGNSANCHWSGDYKTTNTVYCYLIQFID